MSSSHVVTWLLERVLRGRLFEVLIEVPLSPECYYITGMQKSTKSLGGRYRECVKGDRGKPEGKETL